MLLPTQLTDILALAAATGIVTQVAKSLARQLDPNFGGKGSLVLSGIVGVALAALAYGSGWIVPLALPTTGDAFEVTQVVLKNALAAVMVANAAYIAFYAQTFGGGTPPDGTPAAPTP